MFRPDRLNIKIYLNKKTQKEIRRIIQERKYHDTLENNYEFILDHSKMPDLALIELVSAELVSA